jgi:hypothetical protein
MFSATEEHGRRPKRLIWELSRVVGSPNPCGGFRSIAKRGLLDRALFTYLILYVMLEGIGGFSGWQDIASYASEVRGKPDHRLPYGLNFLQHPLDGFYHTNRVQHLGRPIRIVHLSNRTHIEDPEVGASLLTDTDQSWDLM